MEEGKFITLNGHNEHHLLILGGLVHHPATYPSVAASKRQTPSGNPLLVRSHFSHTEKNKRSRLGNKADWESSLCRTLPLFTIDDVRQRFRFNTVCIPELLV